jgi:hypothetical protein
LQICGGRLCRYLKVNLADMWRLDMARYKAENIHIFSFTLASLVLEELVVIEVILVIWLILFIP